MPKKLNIVGKKFGRLTVIREFGKTKANKTVYTCICDCGNEINAVGSGLVSGNTGSCGCLQRERTSQADKSNSITHGLSNHPLYRIWIDIIRRCYNPKISSYPNYGGRGITVCQEWRDDFKVFYDWCMQNGWNDNLEVDRYPNNDGNYEPDNCRLTTCKNNCNNKRTNVKLTINGVTKTATQWAEQYNQHRSLVARRIRLGATGMEAILGVGSGNKFTKYLK